MMDLYVIIVMAAIWAFLPNDGIALVAQWFYKKVVDVSLYVQNLLWGFVYADVWLEMAGHEKMSVVQSLGLEIL